MSNCLFLILRVFTYSLYTKFYGSTRGQNMISFSGKEDGLHQYSLVILVLRCLRTPQLTGFPFYDPDNESIVGSIVN
eukprot:scaffold23338_cov21-Cyclotella_meneghiniana.AAC.1